MKRKFQLGESIGAVFAGLFDAAANLIGGDSNLSDGVAGEQRRRKRDRERSQALAAEWEREDELKRQRGGVLPPDWRNQ